MSESKACEKCGTPCDRDEVDVGVGVIYGPWGCSYCGWSDDERYDCSNGQPTAQADYPNHVIDCRGGGTPIVVCPICDCLPCSKMCILMK